MVGCDASDWSSGLTPFAPMMNKEMRHLFDGEHWEIAPIRSLALFFRALPSLVPGDSLLCLAEGSWDEEIIDFFNKYRIQPPAGIDTPGEFEDGAHLPVEQTVLDALAALAEHHAGPEVAMYIAVSHHTSQLLEWFDVPSDPFSVAICIPDSTVDAFCSKTGVSYLKREMPT